MYGALLDGSLAPMSDRELGRANARGEFNHLALHFEMRRRDLDDPYVLSVLNMGNESFRMNITPRRRPPSRWAPPLRSSRWNPCREPHAR